MPRHKVPEDRRQRIAHACSNCQARKQKCDGRTLCSGCHKRGSECVYKAPKNKSTATAPPPPPPPNAKLSRRHYHHHRRRQIHLAAEKRERTASSSSSSPSPSSLSLVSDTCQPVKAEELTPSPPQSAAAFGGAGAGLFPLHVHASPSNTSEKSTFLSDANSELYESAATRLDYPTSARIFYTGGSASSVFVDEIRKIVMRKIGPCPFTQTCSQTLQPQPSPSVHQGLWPEFALPVREVTDKVVDSFNRQSLSLVEVLDSTTVQNILHACYSVPPAQESSSHCLLYLILAIGSSGCTTDKATEMSVAAGVLMPSDAYFDAAMTNLTRIGGLGNAKLETVQAWALMAVYSISMSKWDASDAYIESAVRTAYALGLHQLPQDTCASITESAMDSRTKSKLWKALFVLDTFVAAHLGRPVAILQDECGFTWPTPHPSPSPRCRTGPPSNGKMNSKSLDPRVVGPDRSHGHGLDVKVTISETMRRALRLMYAERQFPADKALLLLRDASLNVDDGNDSGYSHLKEETDEDEDEEAGEDEAELAADSLALPSTRLLRNYARMLLTRPYFVQDLFCRSKGSYSASHPQSGPPWPALSEACTKAALDTVEVMHNVCRVAGTQSFCNYAWWPFLYTATLIILSNDLFQLHPVHDSDSVISAAFDMLGEHCRRRAAPSWAWTTIRGELDSLSSLRQLVAESAVRKAQPQQQQPLHSQPPQPHPPQHQPPSLLYHAHAPPYSMASAPVFDGNEHEFAAAAAAAAAVTAASTTMSTTTSFCGPPPDSRRFSAQPLVSKYMVDPSSHPPTPPPPPPPPPMIGPGVSYMISWESAALEAAGNGESFYTFPAQHQHHHHHHHHHNDGEDDISMMHQVAQGYAMYSEQPLY